MQNHTNTEIALNEHRFWLQIMGDHSRFIFFSLSPTEAKFISTAQEYIVLFDQLLQQTFHKSMSPTELEELSLKAYEATYRLREFNIELLFMSLTSNLKIHLTSSFINDMLNELEEYLFILNSLMKGQIPLLHPLHHHALWLANTVGYCTFIMSGLDHIEEDIINAANEFKNQFQALTTKSLMLKGFLRTGLNNFTALDHLNEKSRIVTNDFINFLEDIREQRMDHKILGHLMPLMADHFHREECYYILKLSQSSANVKKPDCDPAGPRLEI